MESLFHDGVQGRTLWRTKIPLGDYVPPQMVAFNLRLATGKTSSFAVFSRKSDSQATNNNATGPVVAASGVVASANSVSPASTTTPTSAQTSAQSAPAQSTPVAQTTAGQAPVPVDGQSQPQSGITTASSQGNQLGKPRSSGKAFPGIMKAFESPGHSANRLLTETHKGATHAPFVVFTHGNSVVVADAANATTQSFAKATFTIPPTCIDVHRSLASNERIDILVGFGSGEFCWIDMISGRYSRYNRNGAFVGPAPQAAAYSTQSSLKPNTGDASINGSNSGAHSNPASSTQSPLMNFPVATISPTGTTVLTQPTPADKKLKNKVTSIIWLPNNMIASTHENGCMGIWDPEKEDTATPFAVKMVSETKSSESNNNNITPPPTSIIAKIPVYPDNMTAPPVSWCHSIDTLFTNGGLCISKDVPSHKKNKSAKANPFSVWSLSRKPISGMAKLNHNSPGSSLLSLVSEDGCLRVVDVIQDFLLDVYTSSFGGLKCVAWSPDGQFLITGGDDNIVSLYVPHEQRLIARCVGHKSFVKSLVFDPYLPFTQETAAVRFLSIGDDNLAIIWEITYSSFQRPKVKITYESVVINQNSTSTMYEGPVIDINGSIRPAVPVFHPAPSRLAVATISPLKICESSEPLSSASFLPDGCVIQYASGIVQYFPRN